MSECDVQAELKRELCDSGQFQLESVVIDDWSIYDRPYGASPFALIVTSEEFTSRQDTHAVVTTWNIPVWVIVSFDDWPTSMERLRDTRQGIIDHFNQEGTQRSLNMSNTTVDVIRSGTGIVEYYAAYQGADRQPDAIPQYLTQQIIFEVREGL